MRALLLLLAAAAAPALAAPVRDADDGERYRQCLDLARSDPAQAVDRANDWRANGGGIPARHCLAMAYGREGRLRRRRRPS